MATLLAFAPFLVFAVVDRLLGSTQGLFAGAVTSALLVVREALLLHRFPKILEVGTLLLFGGLAVYAAIAAPDWSILGVRLLVDAGLLLIILFTIAVRRPFTLQYAREQVAPEHWNDPAFLRTSTVISAVWALAFAILVLADLVMLMLPEVPVRLSVVVSILALAGAARFTARYPKRAVARNA